MIISSNLNTSLLKDFQFGLSSDFKIAILINGVFQIYDVFNPGKIFGGQLNISLIGIWNDYSGFVFYSKLDKKLRWNLNGLTLKTRGLVCVFFIVRPVIILFHVINDLLIISCRFIINQIMCHFMII